MRFSLPDFLIFTAVCAITHVLIMSFGTFTGVQVGLLIMAIDRMATLLMSSSIYRRQHRYALLLPRCPVCRDRNRHYWSLLREWPREQILCAICQAQIELSLDRTMKMPVMLHLPRFVLLWPYSLGGRWHRVPEADVATCDSRPLPSGSESKHEESCQGTDAVFRSA